MSVAVFYASALIWAFLCVLVAIVAGAAAGSRTRHWRTALAGLLVGAVLGVIIVSLTSFGGGAIFFLISALPSPIDRFSLYIVSFLFSGIAAALVGLAVGLLEGRSAAIVRRCVVVGLAFGLVLGIANAAVAPVWMNALGPALEAVGIGPLSAMSFGVATMATGVTVDLALAVIAFRFVRRKWGAPPPATAAGTGT